MDRGLMAHLMNTLAVVFKFRSPIGSYRVGEYDLASQTVLANDSVAASITSAAEGVDACISGTSQERRAEPLKVPIVGDTL
jgi:hypothetical protein